MRIGLNLLYLVPGEVGGSEIYARELIHQLGALRPDYKFIVYCAREATESVQAEGWPENVQVAELAVNARNKPRRVFYELFWLPRRADADGLDVLHSLGQTTPLFGRPARVLTVLDLIFHHFPETFPGLARRGLELLVPAGAKRADRVVAISQATKDDLAETYGIDPAKIDVALLGAGWTEPDSVLTREQIEVENSITLPPGEFALCVASGHRHKNIDRLLEAFAALPRRSLVLVGRAGMDHDQLVARAEELGIADRTLFTGWISNEALEGLYREARLFVYPTLLEGFGLPVLEAMHRGVPVVCSNTSSLPEVAGDAALIVDPLSTEAIAEGIERVFTDNALRAELIARGHEQASRFTWEKCAEATLASYERARLSAQTK